MLAWVVVTRCCPAPPRCVQGARCDISSTRAGAAPALAHLAQSSVHPASLSRLTPICLNPPAPLASPPAVAVSHAAPPPPPPAWPPAPEAPLPRCPPRFPRPGPLQGWRLRGIGCAWGGEGRAHSVSHTVAPSRERLRQAHPSDWGGRRHPKTIQHVTRAGSPEVGKAPKSSPPRSPCSPHLPSGRTASAAGGGGGQRGVAGSKHERSSCVQA